MSVYVDKARFPHNKRDEMWCHLFADDLDELHEFAEKIGLKRNWFQHPPKASYPHYDLSPSFRAKALKAGALLMTNLNNIIATLRDLGWQWKKRHNYERNAQ